MCHWSNTCSLLLNSTRGQQQLTKQCQILCSVNDQHMSDVYNKLWINDLMKALLRLSSAPSTRSKSFQKQRAPKSPEPAPLDIFQTNTMHNSSLHLLLQNIEDAKPLSLMANGVCICEYKMCVLWLPESPRRCCVCVCGSTVSEECTPLQSGLSSGSSPRVWRTRV